MVEIGITNCTAYSRQASKMKIKSIGVGAQSTLGGQDIFPKNIYAVFYEKCMKKITKCLHDSCQKQKSKYPNFYDICPQKLTKCPNFTCFFPEKCPNFT